MAGKTPITATLSLNYFSWGTNDPVGKTIYFYKLTRTDWHETQSTWNIYKTGNNWTTPGGDYVTSSPAGASQVAPAGYGWVAWDVLVLLDESLGASKDLELLLKFDDEASAAYTAMAFRSKEYFPIRWLSTGQNLME